VANPTDAACPGLIVVTTPPLVIFIGEPSNKTNITLPSPARLAKKVVPVTAPVTPPQSTVAPPAPGGVLIKTVPRSSFTKRSFD
jgi:hypothetical protein